MVGKRTPPGGPDLAQAPRPTALPDPGEPVDLAEQLGERARFEELVARLSATFLSLPAEHVDGAIEDALRQVVELLGIERSALAQFSEDGRQLLVTHCYSAYGFPSFPRLDLAAVWPWYTERMRQGELLRFRRLPDEVPPEAVAERVHSAAQGPRSHLAIPFRVGDRVLGGLGFGSFRREIDWPDAIVARLRLLADVFANALARKQAREREAYLVDQLTRAGIGPPDGDPAPRTGERRPPGDEVPAKELVNRAAVLSPRERDVMALVARGLLNKQVGHALGIAEKTVKVHRGRVMRKMGAASLAELVRMADRIGLAPPPAT